MESENGRLNTSKYDRLIKIHNHIRIGINVGIVILLLLFKVNINALIICIIALIIYDIECIMEYLKKKELKNLK